jgi:hypothetical protein
MKHVWLLLGVGSLLLYGCSEVNYVKPGAIDANLEADQAECRHQALLSPGGPSISSGQMGKPGVREGITTQAASQSEQREVEECLRAKGWVPKPPSP